MPRKNRPYKRGEPHRDARLFVIACEGKREKAYFEALVKEALRVKVKVLAPVDEEDGKSAPNWVFQRAMAYTEEYGLQEDDQLWLVMDVDRWGEDNLRNIAKECQDRKSWNIALSNPCFELWLILHVASIENVTSSSCQEMKAEMHQKIPGGYKTEYFLEHLETAVQRAQALDSAPGFPLPKEMQTKVYQLILEIKAFL